MCFQDLSFDIRLPIDVLFTTYLKIINFKDILSLLVKILSRKTKLYKVNKVYREIEL